jgi:hypothetical protein
LRVQSVRMGVFMGASRRPVFPAPFLCEGVKREA